MRNYHRTTKLTGAGSAIPYIVGLLILAMLVLVVSSSASTTRKPLDAGKISNRLNTLASQALEDGMPKTYSILLEASLKTLAAAEKPTRKQ